MPQVAVIRPLDEPDLRNNFRLDPPQLQHPLRRHAAAPMRGLAVRQIDEGAPRSPQRLQRVEYVPPQMRREPCSHLSGEPQLLPLVVADEQRVYAVRSRAITANHEFLLLIELQLDPGATAFARLVEGVFAFGTDSLQSDSRDGFDHLLRRASERLREEDAPPLS